MRAEFEARGWQVVRNFHTGFGVPWQEAFNTSDRDAVAAYCAQRRVEAEWRPDGGLRTTAVRRAVHRHPTSGEEVWFNHATFFHSSTLPEEVGAGLRAIFDDEDLPTHTFYGDGGTIPDDVLDHLRGCYRGASVRFDWQRDDVLIVDNMLAAHAREPFTGPPADRRGHGGAVRRLSGLTQARPSRPDRTSPSTRTAVGKRCSPHTDHA